MKKQVIKITLATILVGGIMFFGQDKISSLFRPNYVEAIGDLFVNFGVPSGTPLFNVNNMKPGDVVSKTIIVKNEATSNRPVAIRGIKTNGFGNLEQALDIVISKGGTDLYGGTTGAKTLANFFSDSAGPIGIPLNTLVPNQTADYVITVTFQQSAGNEFQTTNVVFDIKIGIYVDIPAACESLLLSQTPIFGTQKADILKGTNGNDLIITFEGADVIHAGAGNDCVISGVGADVVYGAAGNDVLVGGLGADVMNGDTGTDTIFGNEGRDVINGGSGVDSADGGPDQDVCRAEVKLNCELL